MNKEKRKQGKGNEGKINTHQGMVNIDRTGRQIEVNGRKIEMKTMN